MDHLPMDHKTIAYEVRHRFFPMLGVSRPTRGAADKHRLGRPFPDDWKIIRVIDAGPGGIVEREV